MDDDATTVSDEDTALTEGSIRMVHHPMESLLWLSENGFSLETLSSEKDIAGLV